MRRAGVALLAATAAALQLTRSADLAQVRPNEFTEVGCFEPTAVAGKVQYGGPREINPENCFAFCQSVAEKEDPLLAVQHRTRYFAIEGGSKSCWCGTGYSGSNVTGCEKCSRPAGGALFTEEAGCGGPGPQTASVYLMHFCAHTAVDLEAAKNESALKAAGADQANRKLFQVLRAGQPCSRVHKVQAGSPKAETLVGSLDECKLACGAEVNCAMFTYDTDMSRCLFTNSLGIKEVANDTAKTCYGKIFGKPAVTVEELAHPDIFAPEDVPEEASKEMVAAAAGFAGKIEKEPSCPEICLGGQANIRAKMCENPACLTCTPSLREANCKPLKCPETCLGEAGGVKLTSCNDYFCKIPACEDKRANCKTDS
jgi:hypothetical protein